MSALDQPVSPDCCSGVPAKDSDSAVKPVVTLHSIEYKFALRNKLRSATLWGILIKPSID